MTQHASVLPAEPGSLVEQVKAAPRWSGRTRGGYFGNWFFVQLVRCFGLRAAYTWLVFVAAYFTLASPRSYRCSLDFLRRVLGPQPFWKRPVLVYRHFFSFGVTLLDRLAVIMGRTQIQCRFDGEAMFMEHFEKGKGAILLSAHLGSGEIGGHLLGRLGKPVNLVVLEKEAEPVRQLFEKTLRAKLFHLLVIDENPLSIIPIVAALRRGEVVALHGDRAFGGATLAAPFLGGTARFPIGPYMLAAMSGAPIFQVFVVREKVGQYRFFTAPPKFAGRELLRAGSEKLQPFVTEYAQLLESVARQYPFQWTNFYPFWDDVPAAISPADKPK